jgi:RIO-like serine/threonine protein kinase
LDTKTNEKKQVIDWVYNEETALKDLAGIPGIPTYIASVYEGTKGSVVEGYIDGYELSAICENANTTEEINNIFDRLRTAYTEAAERGYLYNNVIGSTVLVERITQQPYLVDWYNHGVGDIKDAGNPAHERFTRGLKEVERCRKEMLARFADERER